MHGSGFACLPVTYSFLEEENNAMVMESRTDLLSIYVVGEKKLYFTGSLKKYRRNEFRASFPPCAVEPLWREIQGKNGELSLARGQKLDQPPWSIIFSCPHWIRHTTGFVVPIGLSYLPPNYLRTSWLLKRARTSNCCLTILPFIHCHAIYTKSLFYLFL